MASIITGSLQIVSSCNIATGSFGTLSPNLNPQISYGNGTGPNQIDSQYFVSTTVTTGTPKTFDLNAGGLTQQDGTSFSVLHIKEITVINDSTTDTLTLGGGSNAFNTWINGSGATVPIPPGCPFTISAPVAGFAVTASTADILQITSSGTGTPFRMALKGTST